MEKHPCRAGLWDAKTFTHQLLSGKLSPWSGESQTGRLHQRRNSLDLGRWSSSDLPAALKPSTGGIRFSTFGRSRLKPQTLQHLRRAPGLKPRREPCLVVNSVSSSVVYADSIQEAQLCAQPSFRTSPACGKIDAAWATPSAESDCPARTKTARHSNKPVCAGLAMAHKPCLLSMPARSATAGLTYPSEYSHPKSGTHPLEGIQATTGQNIKRWKMIAGLLK